MGNFLYAVQRPDIIESIDAWGETSVEAEDLVVDKGSEGKVVEKIGEVFPYVCIAVLSKTLIVETVHLSDLTGFVVAAEDSDALRVADFESNEESNCLNGIITSINVVTHEEIVGIWIGSTNSEEFHQVVKLTMDVTAYSHRAFHWLHI